MTNNFLEYVYASGFLGFIVGVFALITFVWGSWMLKSYHKKQARKHLKLVHSVVKTDLAPTIRSGKIKIVKSS